MAEIRDDGRGRAPEGDVNSEQASASPLSAVWPGEAVSVSGRTVFVKPWGVKALMTEVPGLLGSLMGKLAPVYEAARAGGGNEAMLKVLMEQAGTELMDFVAVTVRLTPAELEAATAAEFVNLIRAVVRQNKDFFDSVSGLYSDLGRPIGNEPVEKS
jgi:hypothetical protein